MKLLKVVESTRPEKKLMAVFQTDNGRTKTVHFGAANMDDYTITHDKDQRDRYRARHKKDLNTNDPTRAGYLSMAILWGDSKSRRKNIEAYRAKYNL